MSLYIYSPDYKVSHAVQEMAEEIALFRNENSELRKLNTRLESDLSFSCQRLGELEELIVELRGKLSTVELKLKKKKTNA